MESKVTHDLDHPEYDQIDITKPDAGVEISIKDDGTVIWINVDGICVLRVCQIPYLEVTKGGHRLVHMLVKEK